MWLENVSHECNISYLCARYLERIEGFTLHICFTSKEKLFIWYHSYFKHRNNGSERRILFNSFYFKLFLYCICCCYNIFNSYVTVADRTIHFFSRMLRELCYYKIVLRHEDGHFKLHFCREPNCQFYIIITRFTCYYSLTVKRERTYVINMSKQIFNECFCCYEKWPQKTIGLYVVVFFENRSVKNMMNVFVWIRMVELQKKID